MRRIGLLIVSFAALAACASPSAKQDIEWRPNPVGQNHGAYPTNYEEVVKAWYQARLKDPDSAKYLSFSKPRKEHAITNVHKHEAVYGYSTCATVNAKNSYGGYTGAKTTWFLIRDGQIVTSRDMKWGIIYRGHPINCEDGK